MQQVNVNDVLANFYVGQLKSIIPALYDLKGDSVNHLVADVLEEIYANRNKLKEKVTAKAKKPSDPLPGQLPMFPEDDKPVEVNTAPPANPVEKLTISLDSLRKLTADKVKLNQADNVAKILAEYGVKKLPDLKPELYGEVYNKIAVLKLQQPS